MVSKKVLFVVLMFSVFVETSAAKPKVAVAADGFPAGQSTPEGAASDLARAFIQRDVSLFRRICVRPFGADQMQSDYEGYLVGVAKHLRQESTLGTVMPDDPRRITKVFAARHLSKNGPASYGYAVFDFQEVMFVDVEVLLHSGSRLLRRTMVIKDRDGKWYTLPVADISPLLSAGVDQETASVQAFSDVYDVKK